MAPSWKKVTELKPGTVYRQGNIKEFVELTGWKGSDILYIGDHVYSDLTVRNEESEQHVFWWETKIHTLSFFW